MVQRPAGLSAPARPGGSRVAFVGLGIMGARMAHRLLDAGFSVTVNNRTESKAAALVRAGGVWAGTPADAASRADVLITMLSDGSAVRAAATAVDGFLNSSQLPAVWMDMSTIDVGTALQMAGIAEASGVACLDAPVSGGPGGAEAGTLSIMVGGRADVFDACLPVLSVLGKTVVLMGPLGSGQITKACNQVAVAATMAGVAEALVLGAKAGVDPARIRGVLMGGLAQSRILEVHGERMLSGAFEPGFFARLHDKDLHIVLDMARNAGAFVPVSALVSQLLNALIASGDAELDNSAIVKVYESAAALDGGLASIRSLTDA